MSLATESLLLAEALLPTEVLADKEDAEFIAGFVVDLGVVLAIVGLVTAWVGVCFNFVGFAAVLEVLLTVSL